MHRITLHRLVQQVQQVHCCALTLAAVLSWVSSVGTVVAALTMTTLGPLHLHLIRYVSPTLYELVHSHCIRLAFMACSILLY
jgi:hypothetical protein